MRCMSLLLTLPGIARKATIWPLLLAWANLASRAPQGPQQGPPVLSRVRAPVHARMAGWPDGLDEAKAAFRGMRSK